MTSPALTEAGTEALREHVATQLRRARDRSVALTDAVDDDDLVRQHSKLMSPLVWDLAHIGNQEELWLVRDVGGREPVRQDIDDLYDAFQHPRADRPALPLLAPAEARGYVREVRDKVFDVLERSPLEGRRLEADGFAFGMIVQHEQQHDETMLATHQLRSGAPVLHAPPPPAGSAAAGRRRSWCPPARSPWARRSSAWALDNERPAHDVHVDAFFIDTAPVTNGPYAGVHRRRRLRRPALVVRGGLGVPGEGRPDRATVLGARRGRVVAQPVRARRADPAGRAGRARVLPRGDRRSRRGPASGCRPSRSGRRRPASTRPPAGRAGSRGATRIPAPSTPTWGSGTCRPRRSARTRPARRRWACTS